MAPIDYRIVYAPIAVIGTSIIHKFQLPLYERLLGKDYPSLDFSILVDSVMLLLILLALHSVFKKRNYFSFVFFFTFLTYFIVKSCLLYDYGSFTEYPIDDRFKLLIFFPIAIATVSSIFWMGICGIIYIELSENKTNTVASSHREKQETDVELKGNGIISEKTIDLSTISSEQILMVDFLKDDIYEINGKIHRFHKLSESFSLEHVHDIENIIEKINRGISLYEGLSVEAKTSGEEKILSMVETLNQKLNKLFAEHDKNLLIEINKLHILVNEKE